MSRAINNRPYKFTKQRWKNQVELWLLYAVLAAIFAGITTILAKLGLKNVESNLATLIRTLVVLIFAWAMVFAVGSQIEIGNVDVRTWTFLILSGLSTGASWLCFFRALQLGNVNQVTPLKKSSTILTMILAFIFLGEPLGWGMIAGIALIAVGTLLMLKPKKQSKPNEKKANRSWLIFAALAAIFASLTAILGSIGIRNVEANLGNAIRTMAVVPMSFIMVKVTGNRFFAKIGGKSWAFLVASGIATGASWMFFYHALQLGNASLVVPVDKLSIVLTMAFARLFLGERFTRRSLIGLAILTIGTLLPILV